MRVGDPKTPEARVVAGFLDQVWNRRDLAAFGHYVARDVRFHPPRGPSRNFDEYREMATEFQRAFGDLAFETERTVGEGDLVAMQLLIEGTNTGPFRGRAATGKRVRVIGRPWARVREGKIVEFWQSFDELGMLAQLGHVTDPSLLGLHSRAARLD